MRPQWIEQARTVDVPTVADALGLSVHRFQGTAATLGPCPGCGIERRGSSDRRKPVLIRHQGQGWWCVRCEAKGDALDLVAVRLHGVRLPDLEGDRLADVYRWYTARGWCSYDWTIDARLRADRAEVAREIGRDTADKDLVGLVAWHLHRAFLDNLDAAQATAVRAWFADRGWCEGGTADTARRAPRKPRPLPTPQEAAPAPLARPDAAEVARLWEACAPVVEDADVAAWLTDPRRGFDPGRIADRDLARALPPGLNVPRWARFRGIPWNQGSWRCIFPAWGPTGRMESLRARSIDPDGPPGEKAAAAAAGEGSATGMVLAGGVGRMVLETGAAPSWWPKGEPLRLVVTEGETDFLTWATRYGDAVEDAPAVLGLWSGSWTAEIAARIPDGSRVAVRTDDDDKGDRYAARVWRDLAGRCELYRRPKGNTDATG